MAQILLLEPDRVLARTYLGALILDGHTVRICASAQSAITCADHVRPDIVILELQLVAHSGIEFLYEFRSYVDWQSIPIVVLSHVPPGEFSGSWPVLHNELGVKSYHYKSITSLRQLSRTIDELVVPAS